MRRQPFAYGALTPYGRPSQVVRLDRGPTRGSHRSRRAIPSTPRRHRRWAVPPPRFGLRPFRSPLLRASRLISCPRGTEMFQFPRCASRPPMCSAAGDGTPSRRVAPFGDPRIKACVRLPEAYRSLPRPSSAQGTEASTVRPSLPWPPPRIPPRSGDRAPRPCPRTAALQPRAGSPPRVASRLLRSLPFGPRSRAARLSRALRAPFPSALVKVQRAWSPMPPCGRREGAARTALRRSTAAHRPHAGGGHR